MLNWSYTTAVFTDPGSPLNLKNGYSHLPSQEGGEIQYTSFTVKASTGELRFCNKCQSKKPDRSHLLDVQALRPENGPPLPLARDVCRAAQLQGFCAVSVVLVRLLLGVFCDICYMGMERDPQ
jgi:hypothetical protein